MNGSKERLADRLKSIRNEQNKTQQQMADALGVSRMAYRYYENAQRTPDIDFLDRLCSVTKYTLEYLLGITENKHPDTLFIMERLGLSDKAIQQMDGTIGSFADETGYDRNAEAREFLNALIEHDQFDRLVSCFSQLKKARVHDTDDGIRNHIAAQLVDIVDGRNAVVRRLSPDEYVNYCQWDFRDVLGKMVDEMTKRTGGVTSGKQTK